jgi:hypothetical protein
LQGQLSHASSYRRGLKLITSEVKTLTRLQWKAGMIKEAIVYRRVRPGSSGLGIES